MKVTAALLASLGTNSAAFKARCEQIAALVQTDDRAAVIAISRLYDRQTRDEQSSDRTVHSNGVGFQECDAKFGGKIARLVKAGRFIFPKHMPRVRRMAVKYRVQLTVLSFIKDRARLGAEVRRPTPTEAASSSARLCRRS